MRTHKHITCALAKAFWKARKSLGLPDDPGADWRDAERWVIPAVWKAQRLKKSAEREGRSVV